MGKKKSAETVTLGHRIASMVAGESFEVETAALRVKVTRSAKELRDAGVLKAKIKTVRNSRGAYTVLAV